MFDGENSIAGVIVGVEWESTNMGKMFSELGDTAWFLFWTWEEEEIDVNIGTGVPWQSIEAFERVEGSSGTTSKTGCKPAYEG